MSEKGHSEEYFGQYRDDWWNGDFLKLMAQRWDLSNVNQVIDVGCGLGHWSRELLRILPQTAQIKGFDSDKKWVVESKRWMDRHELGRRFIAEFGSADQLPLADNTVDMVTCQTLLIHVPEIAKVLKEFMRVLKPGGLFVAAEPNNIATYLVKSSISSTDNIDNIISAVKFGLICERGKALLGCGDNSVGDLLPGLASEAGFEKIKVYLSDKASPLFPPYDSEEQQALIEQYTSTNTGADADKVRSNLNKQFLAGGGIQTEFDKHFCDDSKSNDFASAIEQKKYHSAGGVLMYLVSGRKPDHNK